jgi:hypothetical protein
MWIRWIRIRNTGMDIVRSCPFPMPVQCTDGTCECSSLYTVKKGNGFPLDENNLIIPVQEEFFG